MSRQYRVVTEVFQETEDGWVRKETSIGETVEADSFAEALPKFNEALNKQWQQVAQMASIVDDSAASAPGVPKGQQVTLTIDGKTHKALILPDQP